MHLRKNVRMSSYCILILLMLHFTWLFPSRSLSNDIDQSLQDSLGYAQINRTCMTKTEKPLAKPLVIFITGASSGIGRAAAILLAQQGHRIYAAARRTNKLQELRQYGVTPLTMDISSHSDNVNAVDAIITQEGRIDVLINNAGFGVKGTVEDLPMETARHQFEVNFFGLAHLTKLVLPHMRKNKSGTIINVSSVAGKIFIPLGAWYVATKHALEGWSDCLRIETKDLGIKVVLVEPGYIQTEFFDASFDASQEHAITSEYKVFADAFTAFTMNPKTRKNASSPMGIAKTIAKIIKAKKPKRRYASGKMAQSSILLRRFFGDMPLERIWSYLIKR